MSYPFLPHTLSLRTSTPEPLYTLYVSGIVSGAPCLVYSLFGLF